MDAYSRVESCVEYHSTPSAGTIERDSRHAAAGWCFSHHSSHDLVSLILPDLERRPIAPPCDAKAAGRNRVVLSRPFKCLRRSPCSLVVTGHLRQVILKPIHLPPIGVLLSSPTPWPAPLSLRRMMELSGDILKEQQHSGNLWMDPFFPNLRTSVRWWRI